MKKIIFGFFSFLMLALLIAGPVRADELEDLQNQINELTKARELSEAATKPLESELNRLEAQLDKIEIQIDQAAKDLRELEASIKTREADLVNQYQMLAVRVRDYYKRSKSLSPLLVFLSANTASELTRELMFRQATADQDKQVIIAITQDLITLEDDKKRLEEDRVRLAAMQKQVDKEAAFFRKEVKGAKDYQAQLSSQIATLTARQQAIISQRQGSLNLPKSLGAGGLYCTDDRERNPGFGNAYAFYTYGIPHRVGMNQYGAYGRAQYDGQDYRTILQAYFNGISFEGGKEGVSIKIQGYGEKPLDEYLLGIYEMPEGWPIEALKAQAVAARSYALAYTNNGAGEICTTQDCQVWKPEPKSGAWKQAVEATRGEVMMYGGEVVKAWYSSTDGGYTYTSGQVWGSDKGWTKNLRDTNGDVGNFGDLQSKAYDRESPCFYAAQGWRGEYDNSAWLKANEVADIVNALMLFKTDASTGEHLYQPDKPHPYGGEVWDENRVKEELRNRQISPVDQASSVSVGVDWGSGRTTSVTVNGNSFNGSEFKDMFNLRAPANIQIVGPLFNIETK